MLDMAVETFSQFIPDETYIFNEFKEINCDKNERTTPEAEIADRVRLEADKFFNLYPVKHYQRLEDALRPPVKFHDPSYAVFKGEDSSVDTALCVSFPWANPLEPTVSPEKTVKILENGGFHPFFANNWHQLEKHAFLFDVMQALGIRDEAGKTIPVVAVPSPSKDWHPIFSSEDIKQLKHGDFSPFVPYLERVLQHEGYGRAHTAGWSLCSGIGQAALHAFKNIDALSGTFGEPLNYKDRSRGETFQNYVLNKPDFPDRSDPNPEIKWTYDGPNSRFAMETFQPNIWQHNIWLQGPYNAWLLWGAMGKPTMFDNLQKAAEKRIVPVTIEYGESSAMTHDIEDSLNESNEVLMHYAAAHKLRIVKTVGQGAVAVPHLHGESPMLYALWIAESLRWAIETNKK